MNDAPRYTTKQTITPTKQSQNDQQQPTPPQSLFLVILGKPIHASQIQTSSDKAIGCNTLTPFAWAITPVTNGKIAAPDPPNAAANPIPLTWRCRGSSFVQATTAAGNKGPRKKPCRDTATAET